MGQTSSAVLAQVYVSSEILAAADRVVLRGRPTGEGQAVIIEGRILEHWPQRIEIGRVLFYLSQVYLKSGAQEAMYERRCL